MNQMPPKKDTPLNLDKINTTDKSDVSGSEVESIPSQAESSSKKRKISSKKSDSNFNKFWGTDIDLKGEK